MTDRRIRGSNAAGGGVWLALLCGAALVVPLAGQSASDTRGVAVIPVHGTIDDVLRRSIERRLEQARAEGVRTVVFEMDTPGGLVTSALDISTLIKELGSEGVRTLAWVHTDAFSAGALISVATQEIVMSSSSSIGDCAPIMVSPVGGMEELGETERAKAESPVLKEFRDSAFRNGYDPLLCRAMVSVDVEVWWVENPESGERRLVDGNEKADLLEGEDSAWRLVEHELFRQPIDSATELLTLSQDEAVTLGFAKAIVPDLEALQSYLETPSRPVRLEISGWEQFAQWLNSPMVRGILFVIMLIGAYIEFQSPGLILPGATALVALGIFLGAPYAAGLADIWTIVLLVVGLILIGVEIFVLPGFGIAGISGVLLVLVSFVGTFVPREPDMPPFYWPNLQSTWDALKQGVLVLSSSTIIAITGIILMARYLHLMPGGEHLVLSNPENLAGLAVDDPYAGVALVGDVGIVTGALRPSGQARFGQQIVDVHSQGEYVESGRRVQVLRHDGPSIMVRPLEDEPAT